MVKTQVENMIIRQETRLDYCEAEAMIREAFWDVYKPGCDEHFIIHKLRESPAFVRELDLVACEGEQIVGMIICPLSKIVNEQDQEFTILSMIIGVLPSHQNKGVGSMLIKEATRAARSLGFKGIALFGSPDYYPRFGFKNAREYRIQTSDGQNFDPFMVLELAPDSLNGIQGRFFEDPSYHPDPDELKLFDTGFPHREKHVTDTQLKI
jgi:predicted N-acetyltransferase YhbS